MAERAQRPSDRAVFVISVAAELVGVHPQTLRIYEREGLVHPKRTTSNSRRYSERDIERLREIQELTRKGVNLAGVRRVIELQKEIDRLTARLAQVEGELAAQTRRHRQELEQARRAARRDLVLPYTSAIMLYRPAGQEPPDSMP
jgi:MerR family transcriptional regulator, heat shock protein HspR